MNKLYGVNRNLTTKSLQLIEYDIVLKSIRRMYIAPVTSDFDPIILIDKNEIGESYFETPEDAINYVVLKSQAKLSEHRQQVYTLKADLDQLDRMLKG